MPTEINENGELVDTNNRIIYLYVKESPLGLKYLGITTYNPYLYMGSGKYWKRHIKSHKFSPKDIKTTIVAQNTNRDELRTIALYYSDLWSIVKSKEWANLVKESVDGSVGLMHSEKSKDIISKKALGNKRCVGRILSDDIKNKIIKSSSESRGTKVINKLTKEVFISIGQAARSVDMKVVTLKWQIKNNCKNSLFEKYNDTLESVTYNYKKTA